MRALPILHAAIAGGKAGLRLFGGVGKPLDASPTRLGHKARRAVGKSAQQRHGPGSIVALASRRAGFPGAQPFFAPRGLRRLERAGEV